MKFTTTLFVVGITAVACYSGVHFDNKADEYGVGSSGKSFAVAFADVDNDGDDDLFVSNSGSKNAYYINDNGHFTERGDAAGLTDEGSSRGVVFGDVNGDGNLDLLVTDASAANHLYLGDGSNNFTDHTAAAGVGDTNFGQGAAMADVDGDGDLDIFVANFGQSNTLYINDGSAKFTNVTEKAGLSTSGVDGFGVTFGDCDGDGDLDLYVANSGSHNALYVNDGKGNFRDVTSTSGAAGNTGMARGTSFFDADNDGDLDLFVVSAASENQLFINQGGCKFQETTEAAGVSSKGIAQGMGVADVNGDGAMDIVVTQIGPVEGGLLYINDGKGKFTEVAKEANVDDSIFGQGVGFSDIDKDGDLDMYFCTYGYPPAGWPSQDNKLYINDGTDYSWLKVQPLNDKGHPVLLGAEVRIFEAGTRTAISGARLVDGGSAFASQSSYDAYFGLNGVAASSFDVEMRRPAGTWVTKAENPELGNVKANSTLSAKC